MVQVLLFSKYFGVKDLGPYNLMIDKDGNVVQVDLNQANEETIQKYNTKYLYTSHTFHSRFTENISEYMVHNSSFVRDFIEKMKQFARCKGVVFELFN